MHARTHARTHTAGQAAAAQAQVAAHPCAPVLHVSKSPPRPGAIIPSKFSTEVEGGFVVFFLGMWLEPWVWLWSWREVIAAGRGLNAMLK